MKKKKLFTLTALAAICGAACLFAGCNADGGGQSSSAEPVREKTVSIADFETWESGFQLIRTGQYFGQIRVNTDPQFVKTGKQSAQIHPLGGYRTGNAPIMFFPTASELFGFDHSDFSDAEKITFEFYNNEETPVKVAVGLVTYVEKILVFNTTAIEYQPLQTGWNTVTYEVNVSALNINADVTNIQGIYIAFENARSREESDAPDIYLDDVVLHRYDEPQEIRDLVELDEGEYVDFEKDWQQYVLSARNTDCAPDIDIVKASEYTVGAENEEILTARSGENVLRIVAKSGTNNATFYPGVEFAPALLNKSMFGTLKKADYGTVTFSFDIYNNSAVSQRFGLDFYNNAQSQRKEYIINAAPYSWTTFSIDLKTLYEDFLAANQNKDGLFSDPGKVVLLWPEYNTGEEREFFVDNMHFTVKEKDTTAAPVITLAPFERTALVGSVVELPTVSVWDRYDTDLKVSLTAYYNDKGEGDEDNWTKLTLSRGNIPIEKAGEYKIVATTTANSVGNITTQEYFFQGVDEMETGVWTAYGYADEVDGVYIDGATTDTNKAEWLESVTLGGETREGVAKVMTDNASQYGAGYIGFRFAETLLEEATETGWDYFVIQVYIEAPVASINLYSWNKQLYESVKTGQWIELKITKDMLNGGKTYVNRNETPVSDSVFYDSFNDLCGSSLGNLLYTTTLKNTANDSKITFYIDKITWAKSENGSWSENDGGSSDIYGDEWADPFMKEEE